MTRYQILNAPSKWTLSVAFFDKVKGARRPVTFKVNGPLCPQSAEIEVIINQLSWEDSSGERWLFEGFAVKGMEGDQMRYQPKVKGYFCTFDRKGWIDLDMPAPAPQPQRQPDPDFVALVDQLKREAH